jgi:hypothetical protein
MAGNESADMLMLLAAVCGEVNVASGGDFRESHPLAH